MNRRSVAAFVSVVFIIFIIPVEDCAGVCGGDAVEDCAGVCGGTGVVGDEKTVTSYAITSPGGYSDVIESCNALGGKLLIVDSYEEYQLSTTEAFGGCSHNCGDSYWIGLNDIEEENSLVWSDGSPYLSGTYTFSNISWQIDDRDCFGYVGWFGGPLGTVEGFGCGQHWPAICEIEEVVPGECCASGIVDCAGECDGSAVEDCAGECGGNAALDMCGTCHIGGICVNIDDGAKDMDGDGCDVYSRSPVYCGGSYDDEDFISDEMCCACGGGNATPNHCVQDCAGDWGGAAVVDCAGVCGGDAVEDCAGVCGGDAVEDCAGVCGGDAVEDCAGECGGAAVVDCAGVCGGTAVLDVCGVCGGTAPDRDLDGTPDCLDMCPDGVDICASELSGDFNCDGFVNLLDIATIFVKNWLTYVEGSDQCAYDCQASYDAGVASVDITTDIQAAYIAGYDAGIASVGNVLDWRIFQTGCGWNVEVKEMRDPFMCEMYPEDEFACEMEWNRKARLYSGQCSAMPEEQYTTDALTTDTTYDGFGDLQTGISLQLCGNVVWVTCDDCGIVDIGGTYLQSICEGPGFSYMGSRPESYICFRKFDENGPDFQPTCPTCVSGR